MNAWSESLNSFSAGWSAWLWRVCWQAAIVVAVAWLLSFLLRRSSPWLRSWIWRLAYVKLLLLLVWTSPINLPLLPAADAPVALDSTLASTARPNPAPENAASTDTPRLDESPGVDLSDAAIGAAPSAAGRETSRVTAGSPSSETANKGLSVNTNTALTLEHAIAASNVAPKLSLTAWLFLSWFLGVALVVAWFSFETWRAIQLKRSARRIENPELIALTAEVCRELGIKRSVQLVESDLASGPMLVKFIQPAIVFPLGMLGHSPVPSTGEGRGEGEELHLTRDEIRLVLAHELAHFKRHDLAWNALSAVLHTVLYFHPFVWFAHRCARQEQELACDELVVTQLGVECHEYGQLLVKIVRQIGRKLHGGVATVAMANSYQSLSRRIAAMHHLEKLSSKAVCVTWCGLIVVGGVALVPWRLVAQDAAQPAKPAAKAEDSQPAAEQTKPAEAVRKLSDVEMRFVGEWLGGYYDGQVAFKDDGTFYELPRALTHDKSKETDLRDGISGRWKIDADSGKNYLKLQLDVAGVGVRGLPAPEQSSTSPTRQFEIVLLDSTFLRLADEGSDTAFYRRVNSRTENSSGNLAEKQLDASLPPDYVKVAQLASLSPAEAKSAWGVITRDRPRSSTYGSIPELPWDLILRANDARSQRIDFAELFGLSKQESAAYLDLYKLSKNSLKKIRNLDRSGQLTETEHAALEKINDFGRRSGNALNQLEHLTSEDALSREASRGGRNNPFQRDDAAPSGVDSTDLAACRKLYSFFKSLDKYLDVIYR